MKNKKPYQKPITIINKQEWRDITWFIESKIGKLPYIIKISDYGNLYISDYTIKCGCCERTVESKYIIEFNNNWGGYKSYTFGRGKNRTNQTIHRLVWIGFNGVIEDNLVIDHINCNKYDNRLCNLRKTTVSGNVNNPITKQRLKDSIASLYKDDIRGNEIRQKISTSLTGRKDSDEARKHKSEALKGIAPWNKGKKCPQISKTLKDKYLQGMSNPMKGKNAEDFMTPEAIKEKRRKQKESMLRYWKNKKEQQALK